MVVFGPRCDGHSQPSKSVIKYWHSVAYGSVQEITAYNYISIAYALVAGLSLHQLACLVQTPGSNRLYLTHSWRESTIDGFSLYRHS